MDQPPRSYTGSRILSVLLYTLAAVVLVAGLFASLWLLFAPSTLDASLGTLQGLLNPALYGLLFGTLSRLLQSIGSLLLVLTVSLALVLFAAGRSAAHTVTLSQRIDRLEADLLRLQGPR